MKPVECNNGHLNDPYPDTGRCVVCNDWMPGNRHRFDSKKGAASRQRQVTGEKANLETAKRIVADDGFEWGEIGEGNRTLVMNWVANNDRPSYVLYLEQMEKRMAAPRPIEKAEDTVNEVHVSDELLKSLEQLGK